jgi:uncharacterized repeat protein (TIGR03803 family)
MDAKGTLYGTSVNGGASNYGSVFKSSNKRDTVQILYSFTGGADGAYPYAGLVQDKSGNFYGTTNGGGSVASLGTIYQLDPTGTTKTIIRTFTGPPDGSYPMGTLIIDSNGNLYGTTSNGGDATCNCGIVFLLAPPAVPGGPWNESVKYRFLGGTDAANPLAGVVRDSKGNLYGTSSCGGTEPLCNGTVFKVDQDGNETLLYTFTGGADGGSPATGLILDQFEKHVFGTAGGGFYRQGVVFKLKLP